MWWKQQQSNSFKKKKKKPDLTCVTQEEGNTGHKIIWFRELWYNLKFLKELEEERAATSISYQEN